ncbi:MAG TPA: metallophosphoesterase [Nocardioidaceae bacterium]|nr:metallophosphoesterase [Nocardioidaceae bacterium]
MSPDSPGEAIRIAAVGDVHLAEDLRGRYRPCLERLSAEADVLLVAGDLTQHGRLDEAAVFAEEFSASDVPVVVVLGNHDYHSGQEDEIRTVIERAGIVVLEGEHHVVETDRGRVGIAGVKGFCLGFSGRCASNFGEPEMKAFTGHGIRSAELLRQAFDGLRSDLTVDVTVALTHYAPVDNTLHGEPTEIWPFLGNYLLGEAIDAARADLAVHGHAHAGCEKGLTDDGTPVRNVAQPVIRSAYRVYDVQPARALVTGGAS